MSAALIGTVVGVALIFLQRLGAKSRLPFGVFLAVAAVIALFWGNGLIATYLAVL